jgi:hypothetical protein
MTAQDNLIRSIPAGEIIKPWIMFGAHNIDFSEQVVGLTYFEHAPTAAGATTQVGLTAMEEIVAAAEPVLTSQPKEGEACEFLSAAGFWNLARAPEPYLSWGTYNIKNHLGVAFLSTTVIPAQPGVKRWRILTRIYERVLAAIGGQVVFDSANSRGEMVQGFNQYTFEADLPAGPSRLTVGLFRLGRMAQVGFRLECDGALEAHAPLPDGVTLEARSKIEEELGSIRFERDIFYPEHTVGFQLGSAAASSTAQAPHLEVELVDKYQRVYARAQPKTPGEVALCQGLALEDKPYTIVCTWKTPDGRPVTGSSYIVRKVTPLEAPLGYEKIDERRKILLDFFGKHIEPDAHSIWREVALYAAGQHDRMDMETLRRTCAFIAHRNDCSDFVIQAVLRLMYWERAYPRLSPEINALMKDTILGFKYWVDEPGDTVMYMGSENHRLLFHVAEWMAGQLFPTEEFTNSRQNGLFHYQKAYVYITEWLRQRGRYGFDEWHSNSYLPVCISPLINLYDFCLHEGQYKLRQMVQAVLDQVFFYLAADTFEGFWGTTHGRSYGIYVKYADFDGTAPCCWILYGTGAATITTNTNIVTIDIGNMAPISLATSTYKPPKLFYDIAHDREAVVEVKQRQGILRTSARNANFVVYRTPDYMLSGLQDHRKGEFESSTHIAQVTLVNKALIFWSCPHTTGEGSGLRPDYWSGHTTLPRVIQHQNVMALTWRLSPIAWMTHCWLEPARFDETHLDGNWAFARAGDGYVGIYSQHGLQWGDYGQYAGRELQCPARENTWLVECGRKADWGSFEAFKKALRAAQIETHSSTLHYHSPTIGEFVTGWDVRPTVAGQPIQLDRYLLYDSPWAQAAFGEGRFDIQYGGEQYEIWFNQ